jgi:glutamate/tyrosine decarboxylase-like PLP-dependent enzyme
MLNWKKLSSEQIKKRVFEALENNIDFFNESTLGVPGSHLDQKVFPSDAPFLKDAPFLYSMVNNPNHIGCHTLGESESYFKGTHALEREAIRICAEVMLQGEPEQQDGYIASGGTEANIQAFWIYRNYFMQEMGAQAKEICILCSEDSHYSMPKGSNLLQVGFHMAKVDFKQRKIDPAQLAIDLKALKKEGYRYFIVVANMMTTMFGSVDDPAVYTHTLETLDLPYKLHVDGAYGGFVYPFANRENSVLHFGNPKVSSITLDAHKMGQAPYGTGIFLARKGLINYVNTKDASYVQGLDTTLIGSRSGANAIAVWMILMSYGFFGWHEKIQILMMRTKWLCDELSALKIPFFREPSANIVSIQANAISTELANQYGLVPDNHAAPKWFKIVVMDHVTVDKMEPFVQKLKADLVMKSN